MKIEFEKCSLKIEFEECSLNIEFKESSLKIELEEKRAFLGLIEALKSSTVHLNLGLNLSHSYF